jgi:hypothetical protein
MSAETRGGGAVGVVELAPVTTEHLDNFDVRFDSLEKNGQYQWFGHSPGIRLREMWADRRLLNGDHNMLSVLADGELAAGDVSVLGDSDRPFRRVPGTRDWHRGAAPAGEIPV